MADEMLLLGVAIFCAHFAFQSPVTTHRAALIFSYLAWLIALRWPILSPRYLGLPFRTVPSAKPIDANSR